MKLRMNVMLARMGRNGITHVDQNTTHNLGPETEARLRHDWTGTSSTVKLVQTPFSQTPDIMLLICLSAASCPTLIWGRMEISPYLFYWERYSSRVQFEDPLTHFGHLYIRNLGGTYLNLCDLHRPM